MKYKLYSKRERWGLTFLGKTIIWFILIIIMYGFSNNIVSFLSKEKTIDAKIMVVEGYIPDYAFPTIIKIFNEKNYDLIITSGTTFDQGYYISNIRNAADLIKTSLISLGFDQSKIISVPVFPSVKKDRTYHSAKFSYNYIRTHYPDVTSVNVVSLGTHSRRSDYLFKKVFEPNIKTGNIVIDFPLITDDNWYKSSRGFKTVLNEIISYTYVVLFFNPKD